ncbi:DUF2630 family protein [Rhodococcus sp. G-MC3]|uniref:DUF2630 family protein n=1 Tax=Rhodococcus sp. G-MC3 TaxID=3046209 RepID=UPI0024BB23A4|nr:DUF2630 family protein [Rhodococcus sp. G-MC3]MDJ0393917.1 DUF2630 family protein [Rhodococcus sp. G-MC3]
MIDDRLSVIDDIFLRTHRGFGLPVVLQAVWRCAEHVDRVDFAAIHANLAYGRLGRRVVTPKIPGARRRWIGSSDTLPLAYESGPIPESDVLGWADAQGDIELDPEHGPGWRMSVAPVDSGGTVVSLVCSHALADAAGLIAAAGEAFEGSAPRQHPIRHRSDPTDAVSLLARVTESSARAIAGLIFRRESRRELADYLRSSGRPESHEAHISTAVFEMEAALTNSEFISLVAQIAAELGEPMPVSVNVPFRSETPGANGIGMATIAVSVDDSPSDIKNACKTAFAAPAGAPSGFPAEIVQLLPDSLAAGLTSSPGTARVLCSNIGALPETIASVGGHPASALVTRALHPGAELLRTTTALSSYISTLNGQSTLALVTTDIRYAAILTARASTVLARRGLPARSWAQRTSVKAMSEHDIYSKIEQLVATEHKLRSQNEAGEIDPTEEKAQLASIEHALDQCWDLLRQRRARHDAGKNPEGAEANSVEQVEHYLQ